MSRPARLGFVAVALAMILAVAGGAVAAPAAVDVAVNVGAAPDKSRSVVQPSGSTVTLSRLAFAVVVDVSLVAPEATRVTLRSELGAGLTWGADRPDATEGCSSTPTTGVCESSELQPTTGGGSTTWPWDVVAPHSGTYTFRAELVGGDGDSSNNASAITIVVDESTGGGGGSGVVSATASAAKLSPRRPSAGSKVTAPVRVAAGGAPVRPSRVVCVGAIVSVKVKGTARAGRGSAACSFRTPRSAKGKTLRGSVSFTARAQRFSKRFAARLR